MPKSIFSAPHFCDDAAARKYLEDLLWPDGPVCPHCGVVNHAYATKRAGVYRCAESKCRKDFTVTMRTAMERSKIALHKWLQAFYLMSSSKKGMSAHQLHRTLGIRYESAWFMAHRIREAMRDGGLASMGGGGGIVEADETYFGETDGAKRRLRRSKERAAPGKRKRVLAAKRAVLSLVERGGRVRSFHIPSADKETISNIAFENIARESRLHSDESKLYGGASSFFSKHESVKHTAGEYVRGDVHTNSVEGYFSIFKRGMRGVYQHCREKHLHRYLAEFDFRYNNRIALGIGDGECAAIAVRGASGKRLTYRQPHQA